MALIIPERQKLITGKNFTAEVHGITPSQFVRQHILRMRKHTMAALLKVSAPKITLYEARGPFPVHHRPTVVKFAKKHGVRLDPKWFDAVPWDPKQRIDP